MYSKGEKGFPWYFFSIPSARIKSVLVVLLIILGSGVLYLWYNRFGTDLAPDSVLGLSYGLAGTMCLGMATALYTLRRRARKRAIGQLSGALQWHIGFGVVGLALLFMHSFGNFNPRSGTFALYGMIALVVSGFIGRVLDSIMPRLITAEVDKALTTRGEDRIEIISQQLQSIVAHNTQDLSAFKLSSQDTPSKDRRTVPLTSSAIPHNSWDLAYITLEKTPQERISALQSVQTALQREQFYRYVIRYWRVLHIGLALLTVGLTIWHITYAMQLLIPTLLHP